MILQQTYAHRVGVIASLVSQMATVLFYLTDVEEGGETIFPLEGRDGLSRMSHMDYRKCDMGLLVSQRWQLAGFPHVLLSSLLRLAAVQRLIPFPFHLFLAVLCVYVWE